MSMFKKIDCADLKAPAGGRCYMCGNWPENVGNDCILMALDGRNYNWILCETCVEEIDIRWNES